MRPLRTCRFCGRVADRGIRNLSPRERLEAGMSVYVTVSICDDIKACLERRGQDVLFGQSQPACDVQGSLL